MTRRYERTDLGIPRSDSAAYMRAWRAAGREDRERRLKRQRIYSATVAEIIARHREEFDMLYEEALRSALIDGSEGGS